MSSGVATKYKYKAKIKKNVAQEGKGKRSWVNVFGSGIIPMFFSMAMYIAAMVPELAAAGWPFFLFGGYVGSVATTSADTLASEVGVFSKSKPRLITNLRRKVPSGTIGAVSLLGEGVAIVAGLFIGVIAVIFALIGLIIAIGSYLVSPFAVGFAVFINLLEILVAFIQAYIFTMLSSVFIGMAMHPEH